MHKGFIFFSPAPITRRKISRVRYIISFKQPLALRSKATLLLQRQCERLSRSRHGRVLLTLSCPSRHSAAHGDVPFTKASVLTASANSFRGDTDANPHRWSPTAVLRKRKQSPVSVSFQLPTGKTSLQIKDQPNALQLFPSGQDKASSKPSCNEAICQQPRLRSDSAALHEWIACVIFEFALRNDQRSHQSQSPVRVTVEAVAAVAVKIKRLSNIHPP